MEQKDGDMNMSSESVNGFSDEGVECTAPSVAEQLRIITELIVCGKLRGELPAGFLSKFSDLPNELILKIWSYLPRYQRRSFRLVSKHWKALWESLREPKCRVSEIQLEAKDDQLLVSIRSSRSPCRRIELKMNAECIAQALSLVYLGEKETVTVPDWPDNHFFFGEVRPSFGLLIIGERAATNTVLHVLAAQDWKCGKLVFKGTNMSLTEEELRSFLSSPTFHSNRRIKLDLVFQDVHLAPGVISDNVIKACSGRLRAFVVSLDRNCVGNPLAISDDSLSHLVSEGLFVGIPACSKITIKGIADALKAFFSLKPAYVEKNTSFGLSGSQLYIYGSGSFEASAVGAIEICVDGINVTKKFYEHSSWLRFLGSQETIGADDLKQFGEVHFSSTRADQGDGEECVKRQYIVGLFSEEGMDFIVQHFRVEDIRLQVLDMDILDEEEGYSPETAYSNEDYEAYDYDFDEVVEVVWPTWDFLEFSTSMSLRPVSSSAFAAESSPFRMLVH